MKKFLCGFIAGAMVFSAVGILAATYVAEPATFKVLVNGQEFVSDPPALVVEGRTYLPLRAMGDALGVPVTWNDQLAQAEVGTQTAPTTDSAGLLDGKYAVEILSAVKTQDYEGKDAVVVTFQFTNNSTETKSFMLATQSKAFQNKVQLDTAILINNPVYNSDTQMKDVQPGGSLTVQKAFLLSDNSPVEVEVSAFLSSDDSKITKTFEF